MPPEYTLRNLHFAFPSDAESHLKMIGVDPYGIEAMLPKMRHLCIFVEGLECKVANIIKQEMLSVGGDAAVARGSVSCSIERTDAILMGTAKQFNRFAEKISDQPFGLREMSKNLKDLLSKEFLDSIVLHTPKREIYFGKKTFIMGILNVTPDSFSDGGKYLLPEKAIAHGLRLVEEGADIIDIGGESSRPGADSISLAEESNRVLPVIKRLAREIDIPISVDTTKAEIAMEALSVGAEIINDISSMSFDNGMMQIVADSGAAIVLMHMRGRPKDMQVGNLYYRSVQGEVLQYLRERISKAVESGIREDQIIVDPGFGFGKSPHDSLRLLKHLSEFKSLGRPLLVGASRKHFVALATYGKENIPDPQNRVEGTAAAVTTAIINGAHIVRVHDVFEMKKVATMTDAILFA